MNRDELHKKILKIQALYLRGGTRGEQQAAKKMLDKLCEKYDLNMEDLEEKKKRWFKYNRTAKFIALKIGFHLGLSMWEYKRGGFGIEIECTAMEWELFNTLYQSVNKMYMRKKAEYHRMLQSEMKGYLDSTYPTAAPKCPNCGTEKLSYNDGYIKCCLCSYTKKIQYAKDDTDRESYMKGKRGGVKQIASK
jgi:hypothetical protein